jgi:hypothetical protein
MASAGQVTVPMLDDHQGVRSGGVLYKVSGPVYLDAPPSGTPVPPTTASWEVLVDVLKATGSPDIGNFPDGASRSSTIQISREAGYSVEASRNNTPDPCAAVQTIVE